MEVLLSGVEISLNSMETVPKDDKEFLLFFECESGKINIDKVINDGPSIDKETVFTMIDFEGDSTSVVESDLHRCKFAGWLPVPTPTK